MIPRNIHLIILRRYVVRNLHCFLSHVGPRHSSLTGFTLPLSTYQREAIVAVWPISPTAVRSLVSNSNTGTWYMYRIRICTVIVLEYLVVVVL